MLHFFPLNCSVSPPTKKKVTKMLDNEGNLPITDRKNINRHPTWSDIEGMFLGTNKSYISF